MTELTKPDKFFVSAISSLIVCGLAFLLYAGYRDITRNYDGELSAVKHERNLNTVCAKCHRSPEGYWW
jgi:hypothetical protein